MKQQGGAAAEAASSGPTCPPCARAPPAPLPARAPACSPPPRQTADDSNSSAAALAVCASDASATRLQRDLYEHALTKMREERDALERELSHLRKQHGSTAPAHGGPAPGAGGRAHDTTPSLSSTSDAEAFLPQVPSQTPPKSIGGASLLALVPAVTADFATADAASMLPILLGVVAVLLLVLLLCLGRTVDKGRRTRARGSARELLVSTSAADDD